MKAITICCFVFLLFNFTHGLINSYVYEFGQNVGEVVYTYKDTIPLYQHSTQTQISVPQGKIVSYVVVTVEALAPPKVDYNSDTQVVSINYSWAEIPYSTYTIVAKAV